MAAPRPSFAALALVLAVVLLTAEAKWKPKVIGAESPWEAEGNTLALRSGKQPMAEAPEPGDAAGAFAVLTLDGEFCYEPGSQRGPVFIHAFTNRSGFLECLWSSEASLGSLVDELPASAQVLFLSLDESALSDALWMREQVQRVAAARRCTEGGGVSGSPSLSSLEQAHENVSWSRSSVCETMLW